MDSTQAMIQRQAIPLVKMLQDTSSVEIAVKLFLEWGSQHDWQRRLKCLQYYLHHTQQNRNLNGVDKVTKDLFQALLDSPVLKQLHSIYEILYGKYLGKYSSAIPFS